MSSVARKNLSLSVFISHPLSINCKCEHAHMSCITCFLQVTSSENIKIKKVASFVASILKHYIILL